MKNEELIELIEDLQNALSKALNNEVIREYDHLQVRAEIAVKKLNISDVSHHACPNGLIGRVENTDNGKQCSKCYEYV